MSTILEALQKSERERKLNDVPTLMDMPTPEEPSRRPIYFGFFTILLLLGFVLLLLLNKQNTRTPAAIEQSVVSNDTIERQRNAEAGINVVVNVVSYSDDVEQRFAMINGKMFRQGEFIRAGLKLVEITKDSVVLNNRGKRVVKTL